MEYYRQMKLRDSGGSRPQLKVNTGFYLFLRGDKLKKAVDR